MQRLYGLLWDSDKTVGTAVLLGKIHSTIQSMAGGRILLDLCSDDMEIPYLAVLVEACLSQGYEDPVEEVPLYNIIRTTKSSLRVEN